MPFKNVNSSRHVKKWRRQKGPHSKISLHIYFSDTGSLRTPWKQGATGLCAHGLPQLWLLFFGSAEYKDRHYCYLTPVEPFVTVTEVIIVTLHHLVHSRDGIKRDWVRTVCLGGTPS